MVRRIPFGLALFCALMLVVCVQTFPLVLNITTHIPVGSYPAETTARFNLWTLWWNSECLSRGYKQYWSAPIFFPDQNAFAYSEPQWLTGLVFGVIRNVIGSHNLPLAYNLVLLGGLILNGWCSFRLLREIDLPIPIAGGGSVLVAMIPTVWDQLGVIQSTFLFPAIMAVFYLCRFYRTRRRASIIFASLWSAACFHISSNLALYFLPALLVIVALYSGVQIFRLNVLATYFAAVSIALLLVAPIAIPQYRVLAKYQAHRPEWMVSSNSASWWDYLKMPSTNVVHRREIDRTGYSLGPSWSLAGLALVGFFYGLKSSRYRRHVILFGLLILVFVMLSLGPGQSQTRVAFSHDIFALLNEYVPGFSLARNPWRFGVVAQLFIGILAGFGLAAILTSVFRPLIAHLLVFVAWSVAFIELLSLPIPLLALEALSPPPSWVKWLADTQSDVRIVHLPMAYGELPEDYQQTTEWMNHQMYHSKPMANGYSGFVPDESSTLALLMKSFPERESVDALRSFGVTHVVIDRSATWGIERRINGSRSSLLTVEFESPTHTILKVEN